MLVKKILNNNIVLSSRNGEDIIVMGKSIGFQKKINDCIQDEEIEKIFVFNSHHLVEELSNKMKHASVTTLLIVDEIVKYAKGLMCVDINDFVYLSLVDHIDYLIRHNEQLVPASSPLIWDVKRFYPNEYAIGKQALDIIWNHTHLLCKEDSAIHIALHFVNNMNTKSNLEIVPKITKSIDDITRIIQYRTNTQMNSDIYEFHRLIVHLQYFLMNVVLGKEKERKEEFDVEEYEGILKVTKDCLDSIEKYLLKKYNYPLDGNERVYLAIYVYRIMNL